MNTSRSLNILKCLILAIIVQNIATICNEKEIFTINKDNKPKCINCPKKCSVCYRGLDNKSVCVSCSEGYYLDSKDQCKPCNESCSMCIGPNINECKKLKSGYFLNLKNNEIEKCDDSNCMTCYSKDECKSCKEEFYTRNKGKTDDGLDIVTCLPCNIDNCKYCEIKKDDSIKSDYMRCAICADGYGLVSGKCELCPENCQYCHEESKECTFCKKGYFLDRETRKCEPIPIENCYTMQDKEKCSYCESHFFLKDNKCLLCNDKVQNCSFCAYNNDKVSCLRCEIGYHKSEAGECVNCIENCNHCSGEKCIVCRHGYFYNQVKDICDNCKIEHCKTCASEDLCSNCESGYFFNIETKKCEKCAENCLKCVDSADNCLICPINYYTLQDQVVTKSKSEDNLINGILNMFLGMKMNLPDMNVMEIKTETKCVKECPKVYKGKDVLVNNAERTCTLKITDSPLDSLSLPGISETSDIFSNLRSLKSQYDEEIANIEMESSKIEKENRSKECNYNGILKKEIRGNYESYYICRCDKDYLGDNCQITSTLYENIQNKLVEIIKEVEKRFMKNDKHSEQIFLKSFIMISKFKVNRSIIEKMTELIKTFLKNDKNIDNKKKLYILYDNCLLNLFDLSEDLNKLPYFSHYLDWDIEKERNYIFQDIHILLDMIESSLEDLDYNNSFLSEDSNQYVTMDTFSYVFSEYKLSTYDKEMGLIVANPNIDTSFNNINNNLIYFTFNDNFDNENNKNNIQIINFAAPLFEDRMKDESTVLVSNLLYLKNINPEKLHVPVKNIEAGIKSIKILFAMNFIPAYEDILSNVYCKAFNFKNHTLDKDGKTLEFDDDEQTILCEYELDYEFKNYYFGIVILR